MLRPTTLLLYCGHNRSWIDSEVDGFVGLCALDSGNRYELLLLDLSSNDYLWEDYSTGMLDRLEARATHLGLPMPDHYVASWGTESATWAGEVSSRAGFKGLYWNGGEERPEVPPPTTQYHGLTWELWIPYSAGTWGIGNVARSVGESGFPPAKICMQPNVYQPANGRGAWDMLKCILLRPQIRHQARARVRRTDALHVRKLSLGGQDLAGSILLRLRRLQEDPRDRVLILNQASRNASPIA